MVKRKKSREAETEELPPIARASYELSAALKEFDEKAETWARIPEERQVVGA
jgi:hypothetical protein